jgi:hypothetical protein
VVLVVPGDAVTSLESAYSSLSRGSEEIHVFADTTTHGPDPVSHLARRWAHPEPKRSATARARDLATEMTAPGPELGPARLANAPMTGRQGRYLAQLGAGQEKASGLTRSEASALITELQQQSGRPVPAWARRLANELGALGTIAEDRRSPAPPPPFDPVPARVAARALSQAGIGDRILAPPPPNFEPAAPNFEPAPAQLRPLAPNFEPVIDIERELALERRLHPPHHRPPAEGH